MKLNGWQRLWVLASILAMPAVTVGSVRVFEWPSAPPASPEMAILQVRGTCLNFWKPTEAYDYARAMGASERDDAKTLRDEFFGLAESAAAHDTRKIEQRLADWLTDARNVVAATGRPNTDPFTIEKAEEALLKLQNEPTDFWGYPSTKAWGTKTESGTSQRVLFNSGREGERRATQTACVYEAKRTGRGNARGTP